LKYEKVPFFFGNSDAYLNSVSIEINLSIVLSGKTWVKQIVDTTVTNVHLYWCLFARGKRYTELK